MTRVVIDTFIHAPVQVCFEVALSVEAHIESAAFSGERVVEPGRLSGQLAAGDLLTFEGRHFGLRQRFTTRFTEVVPPQYFVDEMVRGIFRRLRHVHEFESRDGGTWMRDTLDWDLPLGSLGRIADAFFLRRHMRWFVATKQSHLKAIAERTYGAAT